MVQWGYPGDVGSIPGLGKYSGGGNGNPLQYSCLKNPMDREAWWATIHGITKSQTWLSMHPRFSLPWGICESHAVVSDSLWPHGLHSPWNSAHQNTAMGSHSLLQGIFQTQGLNPGLPHCGQILYQLSHKGSPRILEWVAYHFSGGSARPRNRTGISCIAGGFFPNWAITVRTGAVNAKQNGWKQIQNQNLSKLRHEPKLLRTRLQFTAKYECKCLTNSEIRHWRNSSVGQKVKILQALSKLLPSKNPSFA